MLREYYANKKDYEYNSNSENSEKYLDQSNLLFSTLKKSQKKRHVLKLWKKCYLRAMGAAVLINQLVLIELKITYFGKQMLCQEKKPLSFLQRERQKIERLVIEPDTKFKIFWNSLILVMVLYTASVSPLRLAFYNDTVFALDKMTAWAAFFTIFDVVVDIIFSVDIIINFFSAYERQDGQFEYNLKKIAVNYFCGFFFIDLTATVPVSLIFELSSSEPESNLIPQQNPASILRITRMQKLYRLFRIMRLMKIINMSSYS